MDTVRNEVNNEASSLLGNKPYSTPKLSDLGTIHSLVLGAFGPGDDGGSFSDSATS